VSALKDALIAINIWGDGADAFLARMRTSGIDEWRIRECGDAATALTLARDHRHVALVTSSAARANGHGLEQISLAGLSNWRVRLDLLHRPSERGDVAIRTVIDAIKLA
jgi:DNA-binding transcriptional LysR family regulator